MTWATLARGLRFTGLYTLGSIIVAQLLVILAHKVWTRRERERRVRELLGAGKDVDRALGEYLRNEAKKKHANRR